MKIVIVFYIKMYMLGVIGCVLCIGTRTVIVDFNLYRVLVSDTAACS